MSVCPVRRYRPGHSIVGLSYSTTAALGVVPVQKITTRTPGHPGVFLLWLLTIAMQSSTCYIRASLARQAVDHEYDNLTLGRTNAETDADKDQHTS